MYEEEDRLLLTSVHLLQAVHAEIPEPSRVEGRSECELCLEHHASPLHVNGTCKVFQSSATIKLFGPAASFFSPPTPREHPSYCCCSCRADQETRTFQPTQMGKRADFRAVRTKQGPDLKVFSPALQHQEQCTPIGIKKRCVKVKLNSQTLEHPMGQKCWQNGTSKIGCLRIGEPVCLSLRIDFYGTKILFQ